MILTLYYMTSTCIQSWRLNSMKNVFVQLLNKNTSVVLYKERTLPDGEYNINCDSLRLCIRGVTSEYCVNKTDARVLDLWCYKRGKTGCSILPKQSVNISNWIKIPRKSTYFPLRLKNENRISLQKEKISILLEASLAQKNLLEHAVLCEVENYGIPKAWITNDYFALILETDMDHLTKFGSFFMLNDLCLNNTLEVTRLEIVYVSGKPCNILNSDRIPALIFPLEWSSGKTNKECYVNDRSCKSFYIQMLQKVTKSAEDLRRSDKFSVELDYPPVTITKENAKNEKEKKSISKTVSNVSEMKDSSKKGYSRSCSEDTSTSLLVQHGSTAACSLSASSQFSADTMIAESSSDVPVFNNNDELSEGSDWKNLSRTSLLTCETSSISGDSCRRIMTPVKHKGEQKTGKPPTIVVFSESPSSVENIKNSLNAVLQKHRYTIYSLSLNDMLKSPWMDQASLVVLCGNVPTSLKPLLLKYLLNNGGKLLCLCSDLLGLFLPTFKTAEVRPDEVVTFSYGKWNHVTLLHHIFCYQPSPKSSKFSMDESPSSNTAYTNTPSTVELHDTNSKAHSLQVKVLAAEVTWQTPTLLLATDMEVGGKVLFSQVHLEVDSRTEQKTVKDSTQRLAVLADLLTNYLGLECGSSENAVKYTLGYFLGRHEKKLEFLKNIGDNLKPDNVLQMKKLTLKFCGKDVTPPEPNDKFLPIKLYECPQNFSTVEYFENLKTEQIGRLVVYSEMMTSSLDVLNGPQLEHGFVSISRQQTAGVGRGGNAWISPDGCAMFSLQLRVSLSSPLGQRLSLLQHIIALSIVSAICSEPGYDVLNIGLKWPNDIYAGGNVKIGGLIVTTTIIDNLAVCNAGCALNLNNKVPTTCINEMINEINSTVGLKLPKLSLEKYFAIVFNQLEKLIGIAENGDLDRVAELYYKYWLHSNAKVKIVRTDGGSQVVVIVGIDDYGFLKVRGEKGDVFSVHPDGNSFDMLQGLIAPK